MAPRNLLLVMTDQQRADALGFASRGRFVTPNLDALAANGVVFANAYSASTTCVPARSSLLTGVFEHRLPRGPDKKALRDGFWTIAHALKRHGFRTGLFGKMHFSPINAGHGFDVFRSAEHLNAGYEATEVDDYRKWIEERGLEDLRFRSNSRFRFEYDEVLHPTHWITDNAVRFISEVGATQPFFAVVSYPGPHAPFDPPEPYASLHAANEDLLPATGSEVNEGLPPSFRNAMTHDPRNAFRVQRVDERPRQAVLARLAAIRAMIHHIDTNVGRLLDCVDLSNTLVCFTSDHGDYGGHRGLLGKVPWIPFDDLAKVPFFWVGAGVRRNAVVHDLVQSCDLVPTFLDAVNALPREHNLLDGESLWRTLGSDVPANERTVHSSATMGWPMVRRGRFKLVVAVYGEAALFDLESDPMETVNVAAKHPEVVAELTAAARAHFHRPALDWWEAHGAMPSEHCTVDGPS